MQETPKAAAAYARYVALGDGRSLDKLAHLVCREYPDRNPSTVLTQLKGWSRRHDWQGRIARISRQQQLDAEFAERERVRQILTSGLALTHERVDKLKAIADLLFTDITTGNKRFIKRGMFQDEHFNAGEVRALLATLDDLAKETGGRQQAKDESKGGGADERAVALMSDDERARRVAELLERGRARGAGSPAAPAGPPA